MDWYLVVNKNSQKQLVRLHDKLVKLAHGHRLDKNHFFDDSAGELQRILFLCL